MDFNIKKHIHNFKKRREQNTEKNIIKTIVSELVLLNDDFEYSLHAGILSFKNISPIVNTKIKIKKKYIIIKLKQYDIYVRDII